ncbi:hypothetical protein, partial [Candidatus Fukatsuia symbiotica]|uniref:hypothetical protein n=1 Tax=Candidatus Fukatsuia symbiotica TaxID=1878942 RepID=UPI001C1FE71D
MRTFTERLFLPRRIKPVQVEISEQGRNYSANNSANFRVSWGLRFHRRCLKSGHPDGSITEFSLVIE